MSKKKSCLTVCVLALLALSLVFTPLAVGAKGKDVRKEQKAEVKKLVKQLTPALVTYVGGVKAGEKPYKLVFNNRTKTTMALYYYYMTHNGFLADDTIYDKEAASKLILPSMQNLFGKKVKFDLSSKIVGQNGIFTMKKGKLIYKGGDWGEMGPAAKITSITSLDRKTLKVLYHVGVAGGEDNEFLWMGNFVLTLKKNAKSKYGYIVSKVKLSDYCKE